MNPEDSRISKPNGNSTWLTLQSQIQRDKLEWRLSSAVEHKEEWEIRVQEDETLWRGMVVIVAQQCKYT